MAARAGDDRARLAQAITTLLTDLIVAQGSGWIRVPRDALAAAPDPAMLALSSTSRRTA
ncbi:hypothetical protein [Pararhodospirillum photometricum]|uniref:hypothetical protein n=1 Tax=Pararhodospirillum photometricum TaxID=1084 RepID=UPI0002E17A05|nr:hypothetical protein [Pararhodospirillum photometricum]